MEENQLPSEEVQPSQEIPETPIGTETPPSEEPVPSAPAEQPEQTEQVEQPEIETPPEETQKIPEAPPPSVQPPPPPPSPTNIFEKFREKIQQKREKKLSQILEYLRINQKITNKEVQRLCRVSDATATRYLDSLEKRGQIRQIKAKKFAYYELIQ